MNTTAIYIFDGAPPFRDIFKHYVQLLRPDWLGKVAVHTRCHASFLVAFHHVCRQRNHHLVFAGMSFPCAYRRSSFQPVHFRHLHVH